MSYRNYYVCPDCGAAWESDDEAMPDDQCGDCGMRHISPTTSNELREVQAAAEFSDTSAPIKAATPWKLIDWDSGDRVDAIVGADWTDEDRPICVLPADSPHDKLLMAAPALLAALQRMVATWERGERWHYGDARSYDDPIGQARLAIRDAMPQGGAR